MATDIADIKKRFTDYFMSNETVIQLYGIEAGDLFENVFSKASIENILFDNDSLAHHDLETLVDQLIAEAVLLVESLKPHTELWYRNAALIFMVDTLLVPETDYYDTTGLSDTEIKDAQIVKYATADESDSDTGVLELAIKIATEVDGLKQPVTDVELAQIESYFKQIKDAGVRIRLINEAAFIIRYGVDIYYDGLLNPDDIKVSIEAATLSYINNLPFNGEFSNMALVDAIQTVASVKVVEHKYSSVYNNSDVFISNVNGIYKPLPGYFNLGDNLEINMIPYVE